MSEQSNPMQKNMRVSGFVRYLVTQGHAVGSLNYALATVRTYAKLASQASTIVPEPLALIKTVVGYSSKEGRRVDEARAVARIAHKKAQAVSISQTQARALKTPQDDTPQVTRDPLLMCILLDQGPRVSEVALLKWKDIGATNERLTFYRPKVHKVRTLRISRDTRQALARYRQLVGFYEGLLLSASSKSGRLLEGRMTQVQSTSWRAWRALWPLWPLRTIAGTIELLTVLSRKGTPIRALQDAGGWSSPAMPLRYAESARIANDGAEVD